ELVLQVPHARLGGAGQGVGGLVLLRQPPDLRLGVGEPRAHALQLLLGLLLRLLGGLLVLLGPRQGVLALLPGAGGDDAHLRSPIVRSGRVCGSGAVRAGGPGPPAAAGRAVAPAGHGAGGGRPPRPDAAAPRAGRAARVRRGAPGPAGPGARGAGAGGPPAPPGRAPGPGGGPARAGRRAPAPGS